MSGLGYPWPQSIKYVYIRLTSFVWQVYHTVCRAWAWVCPRAQVKLRRHGWFYSNPPFHSLSLVRPHTNWVTKLSLHVHTLSSNNNSRLCIQNTCQKDIAPKQIVPCANDPTSPRDATSTTAHACRPESGHDAWAAEGDRLHQILQALRLES